MTLFIFPLHLESGWELYLGALANLQAYCIMSPATPPGTSSIRNRESPQHAQTGSFHLRINLASTTGAAAHTHWATCTRRTAPLRKSAELAGSCSAHIQGYSAWIREARNKCTLGTPTTVDSQHNRKLMHTHVYTRVPTRNMFLLVGGTQGTIPPP